jgi:hypothetical protein
VKIVSISRTDDRMTAGEIAAVVASCSTTTGPTNPGEPIGEPSEKSVTALFSRRSASPPAPRVHESSRGFTEFDQQRLEAARAKRIRRQERNKKLR